VLRTEGPRTRAELAEILGLARPTVALRVEPLLQRGIVAAVADPASTGGRRATRLQLATDTLVVVAADIGTTHVRVAVTDLAGRILQTRSTVMDVRPYPEETLTWVGNAGAEMLEGLDRNRADVIAVGVGVPCPIDVATGRPTWPPFMPTWDGFDIPGRMRERFDCEVVVDNDVNIMAIGERAVEWPNVDHFMFVKIASGIGAGIISEGVVQRGARGIAGDIGHVQIARAAGKKCRCGNIGCLTAVASGEAIAADLTSRGIPAPSSRDVVALVRSGNGEAIAAVRQAGYDIGEVLAAGTSFLNPEVIVIGGSLGEAGEHLLAGIRSVVYTKSMTLASQRLSIVESRMNGNAGVVGAAINAVQQVFSPTGMQRMLGAPVSRRLSS